jgi:hypothetical protein
MGAIVCLSAPSPETSGILTLYSEQWRYTGPFSRFNRFKGSFPGLGIATVAFGAYLAAEQFGIIGDAGEHHE